MQTATVTAQWVAHTLARRGGGVLQVKTPCHHPYPMVAVVVEGLPLAMMLGMSHLRPFS